METKTMTPPSAYEEALVNIVRGLPVERVAQILDYARYIQLQVQDDFALDDATEAETLADEARWDAQFAETQDELAQMAEQVRAEIRAGRTQPMVFTKDGRIAPG